MASINAMGSPSLREGNHKYARPAISPDFVPHPRTQCPGGVLLVILHARPLSPFPPPYHRVHIPPLQSVARPQDVEPFTWISGPRQAPSPFPAAPKIRSPFASTGDQGCHWITCTSPVPGRGPWVSSQRVRRTRRITLALRRRPTKEQPASSLRCIDAPVEGEDRRDPGHGCKGKRPQREIVACEPPPTHAGRTRREVHGEPRWYAPLTCEQAVPSTFTRARNWLWEPPRMGWDCRNHIGPLPGVLARRSTSPNSRAGRLQTCHAHSAGAVLRLWSRGFCHRARKGSAP